MSVYYNKKSAELANAEKQYDSFVPEENSFGKLSFFLRKMREIIFCRNHNMPTVQKEKNLRIYRDSEVKHK